MNTTPWASGPGSGGCTVRLGAGSFSTLTTVLCAKAPATSRALAANATSVLMSGVIAKSPLGAMTPDDYLSRLDPGVAFAASVYICRQLAPSFLLRIGSFQWGRTKWQV